MGKRLFMVAILSLVFIMMLPLAASGYVDNSIATLATNCGGMPTFGSFNQHMAEINGTYYASFLDNGYVHIKKSTDRGASWTDLYGPNQHTGIQPACIAVDNQNRLYAAWDDNGTGRMMRFSGDPLTLDIDTTTGECSTKFSFVYSPTNDVFYWSRRDSNGDVYLAKLNTSCQTVTSTKLINHVGTQQTGYAYWDSHYHSLNVDETGRLHMIYNPHYWPDGGDSNVFERKKVLYMYSDDQGATWKKANGNSISIPFDTNDFTNGGTVISTEDNAYLASVLATANDVHILYWTSNTVAKASYDIMQVRLNRSNGSEKKRIMVPGLNTHSTLIRDKYTNVLYMFTEIGDRLSLLSSTDNGDNWLVLSQNLQRANAYYYSSTASQTITKDGCVIGMTTDYGASADVLFLRYKVRGNSYYRLEKTASGNTPSDGSSLRLDGTWNIKNYMGITNGNPSSADGINFGTYESSDNGVYPVPYSQIKGAGANGNNFFGKLSNSNNEGIDLGNLKVGSGLTLEGWFYPTGNQADAYNNTRLITKRTTWQSGNYWLALTANGQIDFGIYGNTTYKTWNSSTNKIQWNKWNYIAVTWNKDSNTVDFYIKQIDGSTYHETIINSANAGSFPDINDSVTIGYSPGWGKGFDGYFDEVRISDYKLSQEDLLVEDGWNFRMEATASAVTPLTDGSSLRLDGTYQIKSESEVLRGNPCSLNGTSFGTYESMDGSVKPVPHIQIKGTSSNYFFGKLNSSNNEGIDLGDLDVGDGLTLEGWFYPTGNQADAYNNTRLITKRTTWQSGNYWLAFTANGQIDFGIYGNTAYKSWYSSTNKIQWNKWNYIAVTWNRDSNDVDFYIKQVDGSIYHETITNNTNAGSFPNISDSVTIGYSSGWSKGFDGYFDEVRISDRKRSQNELLVKEVANDIYYRFEATASGTTAVYDGASLRLDGTYQIKDFTGSVNGNPYSTNGINFGTYESSDGNVSPVPYTQIRGALSNNYFIKLDLNNKEEIDMGDFDVVDGLTFEGWFYPNFPVGDDAKTKGRLFMKWGSAWVQINENGAVEFGIGDTASLRLWTSSNNLVGFQKWNYIAVAWEKGSKDAIFYIKQIDGSLITETVTNNDVLPGYPAGDSHVDLGYSPGSYGQYTKGFHGYMDEVRISNFKRIRNELLLP